MSAQPGERLVIKHGGSGEVQECRVVHLQGSKPVRTRLPSSLQSLRHTSGILIFRLPIGSSCRTEIHIPRPDGAKSLHLSW